MAINNTPFNNPSAAPELVEMWRNNLRKSRQEIPPFPVRPISMKFGWTGGGQPIAAAVDPVTLASAPTDLDPMELDVPFPCRIINARLKAGDAQGMPVPVTATVDVQLSQFETFGGQTPLYAAGDIPALANESSADLDLTGWHIALITGDTITARVTAFSGLATWLTLSIFLRPTDIQIGVSSYTDNGATVYTDANGNPYVYRS